MEGKTPLEIKKENKRTIFEKEVVCDFSNYDSIEKTVENLKTELQNFINNHKKYVEDLYRNKK